jgi:uncharacterized repeat protein (TIGR02543 family)
MKQFKVRTGLLPLLAAALLTAALSGCENVSQGGDEEPAAAVGTPTAAPAAGAVPAGTMISLSSATEGAEIYYTVNGETPAKGSTKYGAAIPVTAAMTIKAIAFKGDQASGILEAAYTISAGEETGHTVSFNLNGGSGEASPRTVGAGKALGELPAPPDRSGYLFGGWNTALDGTGDELVPAMAVDKDLTAYALWWQDIGEFDSLEAMAEALGALPANNPGTAYAVKLGSGVSFADMGGTITLDGGSTADDGLADLREMASGRHIALDLRGISQEGGTVLPAGPWQRGRENWHTEENDYLVSITLPSWVAGIGDYAFKSLTALKSINLEETAVTAIGLAAFGNTGLRTATLPSTLTTWGTYSFQGNGKLVSVDMGRISLTTIPSNSFADCGALRKVVWPPSLETIEMNAFFKAGFVTIEIPATVKEIQLSAFNGNDRLVWFKWHEAPAGASIWETSLDNCSRLIRIEFPETLTGPNTALSFTNCVKLETVILPVSFYSDSVPSLSVSGVAANGSLLGVNPDVKIYVPADKEKIYEAGRPRWLNIPTIEEIITPLDELPESERPENWPEK